MRIVILCQVGVRTEVHLIMANNLLLVEDDLHIASVLEEALKDYGYKVTVCNDGLEATSIMKNWSPDIMVLDVMLPGIDGFGVCKEVRGMGYSFPILMLTALNDVDDRIKGLEFGADDYLGKPFSIRELNARIQALLRRNTREFTNEIKVGDLVLNLSTKTAFREGVEIRLTAREMALLEFFMRNPDTVLSRSLISEKVWGIKFDTGTNMVDVYVNYIRNKIDKPFQKRLIHTVVGFGYRISDKQQA